MTKMLAVVAMITLIVSLGSTVIAIWWQLPPKEDLIRFTQILIQWQVIASGLIIGGASKFEKEVRELLTRLFVRK